MYTYKFDLDRVYDGDTIYGWVDRGFGTKSYKKIRLFGIQAPEIKTKDLIEKARGLHVKECLSEILEDTNIIIKTYKDKTGKYGRILADIIADGENINTKLLERKLVKVYE